MGVSMITLALLASLELPMGTAPEPVAVPHFPDKVHAFVFRNWSLVPLDRMAETIGAKAEEIQEMGHRIGLADPGPIPESQWRRSYVTLIRRNWHLLPYEQLLTLLDWSAEKMEFTLREDDFLFVKLGLLKPKCEPLTYQTPTEATLAWESKIRDIVVKEFGGPVGKLEEPLFQFVSDLSAATEHPTRSPQGKSQFSPRFCYSYFALYGDPLMEPEIDPFPDGYLARLAEMGVDGVWMQGVLFHLAPYPWDPVRSAGYEKRLEGLRKLVARCAVHGMKVYLYLNEPRSMPLSFFEKHPGLKGSVEGDYAAVCTSVPEVRDYLRTSVESIARAVPGLGGFFTITASENLTNCHSHHSPDSCPLCSKRSGADVISEVNRTILEGIQAASSTARLTAWDWGWKDEYTPDLIRQLKPPMGLQSVSEWSLPLKRGGIDVAVGEYSISAVGPGPRATAHWKLAREQGLRPMAKIQAGVTWELGSVPYIPAVANVAKHIEGLRSAQVEGLMLGWTLGGYPSPNLKVVAEMGSSLELSPDTAMHKVAEDLFGPSLAPAVTGYWKSFSEAFSEFPYSGSVVYSAPVQIGPANLLYPESTGYRATMVGIPYDDLAAWSSPYPPDVFIDQFRKVAGGMAAAVEGARRMAATVDASPEQRIALDRELGVAQACALTYRAVVNQSRYVQLRDSERTDSVVKEMRGLLDDEIAAAKEMFAIQSGDSRIGFEATNHYFYVPLDLVEKVINVRMIQEGI